MKVIIVNMKVGYAPQTFIIPSYAETHQGMQETSMKSQTCWSLRKQEVPRSNGQSTFQGGLDVLLVNENK